MRPELKETLVQALPESRLHLERLQLIFTHWGEAVPSQRCPASPALFKKPTID